MSPKKLVLGFGISGKSAAQLLRAEGAQVVVLDKKWAEFASDPLFAEGALEIGLDEPNFSLEGISQVILSPGISQEHPLVKRARELQIEVIGEIELGGRLIRNRCVGVTGSNGKTTTVLLIVHVLKSGGIRARALGNVGVGLSGYLLKPDLDEILILELSSFQLETLHTPCLEAALLLNITPNHLDRHPSFAAYAGAKLHIQNCLKKRGKLFTFKRVVEEFGESLRLQDLEIINSSLPELRLNGDEALKLGVPERQNIEAAYAICTYFGVSDSEFAKGIKSFRKPPHRIEWVAEINGVSYYNDSKSTSVDSVMHAVNLFSKPIVLIIGGLDKGASYRPWIEAFRGKVRQLIAYGQAASKMSRELSFAFSFEKVETLKEAVALARTSVGFGEIVLLSPGCSSYDQFENYEHRGEEFKRYIQGE